jgi:hypothetical protein
MTSRPSADDRCSAPADTRSPCVSWTKLTGIQINDDRGDPRPILHRRHNPRRGGAAWSPTRAATGDGLRFGHLHPHRRQIKHLLSLHTHLWRQTRTADTAAARLMPQPLIRINNLRQRRPRLSGLSTWLATTRTPQRLRRRLAKQRIRRRWLRRVPRVLPQPCRQLSNLCLKLPDPLSLHRDQNRKLLIRRTVIARHNTMINVRMQRSTSHAEDLTSYYA